MNIIDRPADEEVPLIVIAITPTLASPPRRHSFNNNDDGKNSLPSELSSLMLTPINYNPDIHCHESNSSGPSSVSISYKNAFRLAAFFAILSIAALACVDVIYFVGVTPSEPETETNVSALQTERSTEVSAKELKSDKKKKKKKKKHKKVDNKEDDADEDDEES